MINEIPTEMMPEMFVVPITVPPVTYAKVIIQGDNITIEPRLKTNADRIRSMTDEELAEFMCHNVSNGTVNCAFCVAAEFCRMGHNGWLDWLKQESEGE